MRMYASGDLPKQKLIHLYMLNNFLLNSLKTIKRLFFFQLSVCMYVCMYVNIIYMCVSVCLCM